MTRERGFRIAAGIVFALFVLPYHVVLREAMNPDGVSYLDLWKSPVNSYWAPMLPAITFCVGWLRPIFGLESFAYVQIALLIISAFVLISVLLLLNELWIEEGDHSISLGVYAISATIWTYTVLVGPHVLTPDGLAGAFAILAAAILLRARRLGHPHALAIVLGIVLALAYFAKYPMFVFGWLLLALYFRRARAFVCQAALVFLAVSALWITPLSLQAGHITFAETGRLNLAWFTGQAPMFAGFGPAPDLPVTYSAWFDPVAAHRGLKVSLDAGHLFRNVWWHVSLLEQSRTLQFASILVLVLLLQQRPKLDWRLLWPAIAVATYIPVTLMSRYAGLWLLLALILWKTGPRLRIALSIVFFGLSLWRLGSLPGLAGPFNEQFARAGSLMALRGKSIPVEGDLFEASMILKRIDARIQSKDHGESRFPRLGHYGLSHGPPSH